MVLFRYLLISLLLVSLQRYFNVVECFAQECEFYADTKTLDCSDRNLTKVPDDVFSSEYEQM